MDPQSQDSLDRLEYASLSDIGLRRTNNQDSMAVMVAGSRAVWQQRGDLFMVADGMGAHAAGELASKLATDTVPLTYLKLVDRSPPEAVMAAVHEANARIHARGQASPDFKGMGTTSTTLLLLPQGAVLAHVGDSRAYRVRGNRLEQLTFDHSLVWEMRASGQMSGEVPDYIPKNIITRSLGPNAAVQVDLEGPHPLQAGDTFLLCSDGLSGQVKDDEIGLVLSCLPPPEAAQALIDLANLRGGPDNITVIIARAVGSDWSGPSSAAAGPRPATRPVHPFVWTTLGVLGLAGLGLLMLGQLLPAALILAAAVLAAGGALVYRQGGGSGYVFDARPLGRGPYVSISSVPTADFVRKLAEIVAELDRAVKQGGLSIDTARLNPLLVSAKAAVQESDFPKAVRFYGQAISFTLAELKKRGKGQR